MARAGNHIPELDARVTVDVRLAFYWQAFWDLTTDRQIGMGIGPIPWSAVDRYAARHRLDDDEQFDLFARFVRAMDAVFLKTIHERQKRDAK